MPMKDELNRLVVLPNTEHLEVTGIFEELPAAIAWVSSHLVSLFLRRHFELCKIKDLKYSHSKLHVL